MPIHEHKWYSIVLTKPERQIFNSLNVAACDLKGSTFLKKDYCYIILIIYETHI